MKDGSVNTVQRYFEKTYSLKITQPKQPLFLCEVAGKEIHLPMEFCLIDGIQGTMQKNDLREVLKRVQQGPDQKLDKIQVLVDKLYKMAAVKDWDIQIDPEVI